MNRSPARTAREMMKSRLVTLNPCDDIFDAVAKLLKNRISGAPVIDDDGQFFGVFSERNCMNIIVKAAYDQLPTNSIRAFVDRDAPTISPSTDLLAVAETFQRTGARRLPVVENGELIGQISRRDLMREVHGEMKSRLPGESNLLYLSSLVAREEAPIS